ncbi:MAG: ABC transporter permease [Bacillota bacterium]
MKALLTLTGATYKEIIRDRMSLFWFLAFPVLFVLLFGAIFSNTASHTFHVGVAGGDGTVVGEAVRVALRQVPVFSLSAGTREAELEALRLGKRSLVIDLPDDSMVVSGQPLAVALYYDQGQQAMNQVLISSVSQVLHEIERQLTGRPTLFQIRVEAVQAQDLKAMDILLPNILAMALMQLGLFGSLRLVSLRERKILKRLGATPLPRSWLVGSEVVVRLTIGLIQALVLVGIAKLVFGVVITGHWLWVMSMVLLGAVVFVAMGYMLVAFAKTEESGLAILQVFQFPMMFLSGIFFPVDRLPSFLQPVIKAIPLTYLADALRQMMTGVAPLYPLTTNIAVLVAWLGVSLVLSVRLFRWE